MDIDLGARYARIAESIMAVRAECLAAGMLGPEVDAALKIIEENAVREEAEAAKAFCELVRHCGTAVVAERKQVSRWTVRRKWQEALNKLVQGKAA